MSTDFPYVSLKSPGRSPATSLSLLVCLLGGHHVRKPPVRTAPSLPPNTHTHIFSSEWICLLSPQGCFTPFSDPSCYLLQGCSLKLPYAFHSLTNHPNTAPSLQSTLVPKLSIKYSFLKINAPSVHSNIIYSSQDMEATQVPINRWMVKKMWYT